MRACQKAAFQFACHTYIEVRMVELVLCKRSLCLLVKHKDW